MIAKTDGYGSSSKGRLELTLSVEQPAPPRRPSEPRMPYVLADLDGKQKARPVDIQHKPDESDEDYDAREAVVKRRQEQHAHDRAVREYEADVARFEREKAEFVAVVSAHRERVMSYAQLVGIAAVFGNEVVQVVLTPLNQDLLPGFGMSLLAPAELEELA